MMMVQLMTIKSDLKSRSLGLLPVSSLFLKICHGPWFKVLFIDWRREVGVVGGTCNPRVAGLAHLQLHHDCFCLPFQLDSNQPAQLC